MPRFQCYNIQKFILSDDQVVGPVWLDMCFVWACTNYGWASSRLDVAYGTAALKTECTRTMICHQRCSGVNVVALQAAHMTNGMYLQPKNPNALLQYLSSCFAASVPTRTMMEMPKPKGASFKATCFCHANAVDVGYVCSVCLSVFCSPLATCMTCGTEYTKQRKST